MSTQNQFKSFIKGGLLDWVARHITRHVGYVARSYRKAFYLILGLLFATLIGLHALVGALVPELKSQSLDFAVRYRLASPEPDANIVILDIDERSLALMAEKYGRWPWPRSVLAEAIATLNDQGARAIAVNVMLSDPDKANPEADQVFQEVASTASRAVYPLIRLNPKNDAQSQVKVSMIAGGVVQDKAVADKTIAVLFPYFSGTHDKLGVSNLATDKDGVVRRYAVWLNEPGFRLPSLAQRAAAVADVQADLSEGALEKGILLNWRNKRGDYRRVSFADAYAAMNGEGQMDLTAFRDAIVVVGVSAPGIATVKGTAASPVTDDNVILATAIDDLKNGSYLRRLPDWLNAVISLLMITALAWAFYVGVPDGRINRWFGLGQSALLVTTLGSISYTHFLIDLTDSFLFALAFFTIAKMHALADRSAARGATAFAQVGADPDRNRLLVIGFSAGTSHKVAIVKLREKLEHLFGVRNVFLLENLFGDAHLFSQVSEGWRHMVIFASQAQCRAAQGGGLEVRDGDTWRALDDVTKSFGVAGIARLEVLPIATTQQDPHAVQRRVGELLIALSGDMLRSR
ncbi:MAG TPA: CHASE2 domain-containing protein [Burkholderiales bacterium]|nr:CHASE2 domain-containing protein [Burkholderiales bacterium]